MLMMGRLILVVVVGLALQALQAAHYLLSEVGPHRMLRRPRGARLGPRVQLVLC